MNNQQNAFSRFFSPRKNSDDRSGYFARNLRLFLRIVLSSAVAFCAGFYLQIPLGRVPLSLTSPSLYTFFSAPFDGVTTLSGILFKILRYALPQLIPGTLLLLSFAAKNKPSALLRICFTVQLFKGLKIAMISVLFTHPSFLGLPITLLYVCEVFEIVLSLLLCVYAYRVSLCMFLGFPRKKAAPGTARRFCSYSFRFLLWTLLLCTLRTIVFSLL